ncbi:MAG: nuclear transport factor 2 family protein [Bdellovibrionales bacterium]
MYGSHFRFSSILFSILLTPMVYGTCASARAELVQPVLINGDEARKFCLEVWFPRLRIGHTPTAAELKHFVSVLMELYTEDIELVDPNNKDIFGTEVIRGKEQVSRYYEAVLGHYPEWEFSILDLFPTPSGFVLRYEGRNAPPVARFEGIDVIELRKVGGAWKIAKLIGYYDRKPFTEAGPN